MTPPSRGWKQSVLRNTKMCARSVVQLALTLLAYVPSHTFRKAGLRLSGARIGPKCLIYRGLCTFAPWRLTIGRGSIVGDHAILDARGGLIIGDNVNLSTNVAIWTGQHDYQSPVFAYVTAPVHIGNYVWLSFRTTILPGVTVGEGAVVAAGAVVTKDVPPYTIVAGIPARVIGARNRDLRYNLMDDSNYLHFV